MLEFMQRLVRRKDNEKGASAVEYGLLVAAIAAIIIVLVFVIGKYVKGAFQQTCNGFEDNASVGVSESCG
jgi:pilus assembly protein Flp/PilA